MFVVFPFLKIVVKLYKIYFPNCVFKMKLVTSHVIL